MLESVVFIFPSYVNWHQIPFSFDLFMRSQRTRFILYRHVVCFLSVRWRCRLCVRELLPYMNYVLRVL